MLFGFANFFIEIGWALRFRSSLCDCTGTRICYLLCESGPTLIYLGKNNLLLVFYFVHIVTIFVLFIHTAPDAALSEPRKSCPIIVSVYYISLLLLCVTVAVKHLVPLLLIRDKRTRYSIGLNNIKMAILTYILYLQEILYPCTIRYCCLVSSRKRKKLFYLIYIYI